MDDNPDNSSDLDVSSSFDTASTLSAIVGAGYKYDEWILQALSTIDEDNCDGNGRDIDGLVSYIVERHEVDEESFPDQLLKDLDDLIAAEEIKMVDNRYQIVHGYYQTGKRQLPSDEPVTIPVEEVLSPTQTTNTDELTSNLRQDQASPWSPVRTESENREQLEALVDAVIVAEHFEFKAKEAYDSYYTSLEMLNDNNRNLSVARGMLVHCNVLTESSSLTSSLASSSLTFCFVPYRFQRPRGFHLVKSYLLVRFNVDLIDDRFIASE